MRPAQGLFVAGENNMLPTAYQQFIHVSRYARWRDDLGRRETWEETVDRYINFWIKRHEYDLNVVANLLKARHFILTLQVMPSMRALMTAGPALDRDNIAGYNCSFVAIDHPKAFDEIMYVLMCGTGVGFSVEQHSVDKLPIVAEDFHDTPTTIVVPDSRIGWASSYRELISLLYSGRVPKFDTSKLRPRGAKLKTFGGRASGPEPLVELYHFSVALFKKAAGRRLTRIECHDLVCKIADVVVVGGVRRSALISLSDLGDDQMRAAKSGTWYETHGHRMLSNNSAVYDEEIDLETFMKEWMALYASKSGERGIFNRVAAKKKVAENGRRKMDYYFGTNPCGEILLRPMGLCNLTEVVVRYDDTLNSLVEKVQIATFLGTLQSTLTDFRYVRKEWKKNAEEERLLGVSLTGIMDHVHLSDSKLVVSYLGSLKQEAIEVNAHWAKELGIAPSAAITCIKPSGTVSQLVNSASGIHPRYNGFYVRRVMNDNKDPVTQFLIAAGVPHELSVYNPNVTVFEFPMAAPVGAKTRKDVGGMEQLEIYAVYRKHWCEHNPSITVYYDDENFLKMGQWVRDNFDEIGGIAFLPTDNGSYKQAPYEDITEEEYMALAQTFPVIDWSKLAEFEQEDTTTSTQDLACSAGVCSI